MTIRFLLIALPLCLLCPSWALAQHSSAELAVLQPIKALFDGMRAADSSAVRAAFYPGASMQTTFTNRAGQPTLRAGSLDQFVQQVGGSTPHTLNEQIWHYDVRMDGHLATVWTPYTFFVGERLSHCGVNAFQLFHSEAGWRILQVTDTRHSEACQTVATAVVDTLHRLVDAWHQAAAVGDAERFFGSMTPQGVYIGTDATERWLRDDMREWAKPYFERGSAWAFTARERQVYLAANGQTAWWEELLDTWMGVCRGSGVLEYHPAEGWRIAHFHLSVTVPNEKIKAFIELVERED